MDDVKEEENGFIGFLGDVGSGAMKIGKGLLDFLLLEDVNTLADKNASGLDKDIVLASFIPIGKVLEIAKAIDKIVDSNVGAVVKKSNVDEVVGKGTGVAGQKVSGANSKVIEELEGPVIDGTRVGSGEKVDEVKPVWGRDEKGKPFIEKESLMYQRNMVFLMLLIIIQDLRRSFYW